MGQDFHPVKIMANSKPGLICPYVQAAYDRTSSDFYGNYD
jgi:hypothetical protein